MTKRLLTLLLAIIMCLSLVSCGGGESGKEEKDGQSENKNSEDNE